MKRCRSLTCLVAAALSASVLANPMDETQLGCVLQPSSEIELSSSTEGVIASVEAERGDTVREGQVLLTLVSAVERAALDIAQERAAFAARNLERNQELLDKELLSGFERDELLTEKQLADLTATEVQVRLEQKVLRSPINGVVAKRHISVGEYVGSDSLMKLVALNPMHAEILMRADYYGQIKRGMKVMIEVEGPVRSEISSQKYEGKVIIVDRVIDAASTTFGVRVSIPNRNLRLPAGLKCRVVFPDLPAAP